MHRAPPGRASVMHPAERVSVTHSPERVAPTHWPSPGPVAPADRERLAERGEQHFAIAIELASGRASTSAKVSLESRSTFVTCATG